MSEFSWSKVGQLFGTNIVLVGEDTEGLEHLVLPSGLTIATANAFPHLLRALQQFDLEELICLVAEVSAKRFTSSTPRHQMVHNDARSHPLLRDYLLACILKLALADPDRTESTGTSPNGLALARLSQLAASSRCGADGDDLNPSEFFMRMAYQQFWDQESFNIWPRGLMILREMGRLMAPADRYDVDQAFKDLYEFGFTDFVFLCFALFSVSIRQGGRRFGVEQFTSSPSFQIGGELVDLFLDLISITPEEYRKRANSPDVCIPGFEMYNFNPLIKWPALRHSAGGVVVPIARLLLDRATRGIYYDFFGQLEPSVAGRFGNYWGKAFETYVGEMLRITPGLPVPEKGEELIADASACDWLLRCGDRWVLIECKTRGLSLRSKTTGETSAIEQDILGTLDGSSLSKGVAQLAETEATLRRRGIIPETAQCIGMLVTFDEVHFANYDDFPIKRMLREGAKRLTDQPLPDFVVASVSELENVCRVVETMGCDLGEILSCKLSTSDTSGEPLGLYVNRTYKPPPNPISFHSEYLHSGMEEILAKFQREPS